MNSKQVRAVAALIFAATLLCETSREMQAQDHENHKGVTNIYLTMASVAQYMMDRDAEIALARTAAPAHITRDATVLVLGRQGYETAVEGNNGFVCIVERSFMAPFESPEFSNPKNRSPDCYNPPAARSVLPAVKKRAEMALAGLSKEQMIENAKAAKANKEFSPPEPGAMAYMMSKQAYLTDKNITTDGSHTLAHVMFLIPTTDAESWGTNSPQSP